MTRLRKGPSGGERETVRDADGAGIKELEERANPGCSEQMDAKEGEGGGGGDDDVEMDVDARLEVVASSEAFCTAEPFVVLPPGTIESAVSVEPADVGRKGCKDGYKEEGGEGVAGT